MGQKKEAEQNIKVKKTKKRWSAGKWLLFIVLLLVVFAAVPVVNELIPQRVKVKYVTFGGEETVEYDTNAHTVSGFTGEPDDGFFPDEERLKRERLAAALDSLKNHSF